MKIDKGADAVKKTIKVSTIRETAFHLSSLIDAVFFVWMGTKAAGNGFNTIDLVLGAFIIGSIIKSNRQTAQALDRRDEEQFKLRREVERLQNEKRILEWQDRD